ncbi:alpha-L-fucosidase [Echinicola strongylocentroti]|uniref:alpha-L-fucosidase n=1 Tax=Echinicola strongylocentroti TaxID=1795355 RepID=A0A2Z4IME7_9BACT|nr:alpha-L-fucosidase [Echinicola strongylocentroti]AWW31766.1 alpha-L-fucosidase [Echinicola strongylocentroti]
MKRKILGIVGVLVMVMGTQRLFAQHDNLHRQSSVYEAPTDPAVIAKLDNWQDLKFGMIIHWGVYAVPGMIESWALCSEDWINRDSTVAYHDFKEWYWGLKDEFNPVDFDPGQWADAADAAGMKYVVFTTKHHDGFNMFDTQQTDYKITDGPFSDQPKANVAKYVFDAFRERDFMIGAYFSKPDWHSQYYWWDKYATADRNNNYDIRKNEWRWNKFKEFTFDQISELMHDYGSIDILWLDGGWVRPLETVNEEVRSWGARIPEWSQDIDMPKIARMARKAQPGLLMVDRTVHGPYENYQTPEQSIPEEQMDVPWEACMTLGHAWGYHEHQNYKSVNKVIHTLTEVVAKGGSLLLGVGPTPKGLLTDEDVNRLKGIGDWLDVNGAAIYGTRTVDYYQEDNVYFTKDKQGNKYAIVLIEEGMEIPNTVSWSTDQAVDGNKVTLLEGNKALRVSKTVGQVIVTIPEKVRANIQQKDAIVFAFK